MVEVVVTSMQGTQHVFEVYPGEHKNFWRWETEGVPRFLVGDGECIHEFPAVTVQCVTIGGYVSVGPEDDVEVE